MSHQDKATLQSMLQTMNDPQIAKALGVSDRTIGYWRRRFGLPRSTAVRNVGSTKYDVDRQFFSRIDTPEKAYIVGLIIADGYVYHNRTSKGLGIQLKESDGPLLEAVRDAMSSTHPVRNILIPTGYTPHTMAILAIASVDLVGQLAKLGIHPNKTATVGYPTIPTELESHLIRGLFDGDGHVGQYKFELIGTAALLDGAHAAIKRQTGHSLSLLDARGYHLMVGYRRDADVLHWLYQGATLALPRKLETYRTYWTQAPRT